MSAKPDPLAQAWRTCNAITAAVAAGRHACTCGEFGSFRLDGRWHCRLHVKVGTDGLLYPNPDAVRSAIVAGRRSTDEARDERR